MQTGRHESPKPGLHKHREAVERELAAFCVGVCDGGRGTRAEAGAHDVQVFAREAGLLLQLTL